MALPRLVRAVIYSCLATVALSHTINKTPLFPDAQGGLSAFTDLAPLLPGTSFTLTSNLNARASDCNYGGGPDECQNHGTTFGPFYNAVYSDRPDLTVLVCACIGAPMSPNELATNFGKVPSFLRQWVTSVSSVPDSGGSAYTGDSHITFFGGFGFDVFVHESAHAQDQGFSTSAPWLQAINSDTCVPDDYAQVNSVEDYAQVMVVFLYQLWAPQLDQVPSRNCSAIDGTAGASCTAPTSPFCCSGTSYQDSDPFTSLNTCIPDKTGTSTGTCTNLNFQVKACCRKGPTACLSNQLGALRGSTAPGLQDYISATTTLINSNATCTNTYVAPGSPGAYSTFGTSDAFLQQPIMSMTCPGGVYRVRSGSAVVPTNLYYTNASHQGYSPQVPYMFLGICAGGASTGQNNISSGYLPVSSGFSPSLQEDLGYDYFSPHGLYFPPTGLSVT